ncbi:MAG: fibronectin type III domain-containing protein, partial [FCB group bacterium]|nr:fibronectin type III domain-containing protein [FCB group bacterium]
MNIKFSKLLSIVIFIFIIIFLSCSESNNSITAPTDTTPPAAVIDLQAINPTGSSITLVWTAPGDDGKIAKAKQYDMRYDTTMIADSNWDKAIKITNLPPPKVGGYQDTFVVTGLQPTTTYYFALKTADEVPNWSGLSNIAHNTTLLGGNWLVYSKNDGLPSDTI